jgi:hypothetical protein
MVSVNYKSAHSRGHTGIGLGTGLALLVKITFLPEAVSTLRGAIDWMEEAKVGSNSHSGRKSSSIIAFIVSGGGVKSIDRPIPEALEREAIL